ncbi:MAG: disulfide oxidoreductase [Candidatus Diapherotrites archaeon]|uniref:Disulfide oxidoreductase n=1 Tax=Candidatus Iainarchaeum sp. TaxID=3101447 RepID=A0A2D6M1N9_9ARCH|nr:disulfide oxidoreductase [Candidatus Diapherotrites archaeon]|tara:strand:+ start:5444 stop:5665 length:222 start_codon:yes stop_codon:yes gene_type:complete
MTDDEIKKDMTLGDIITKHPETAKIMVGYGLHCIGCHVATWETLEQGAKAHGLGDKQIEDMLKEMNDIIEKKE